MKNVSVHAERKAIIDPSWYYPLAMMTGILSVVSMSIAAEEPWRPWFILAALFGLLLNIISDGRKGNIARLQVKLTEKRILGLLIVNSCFVAVSAIAVSLGTPDALLSFLSFVPSFLTGYAFSGVNFR